MAVKKKKKAPGSPRARKRAASKSAVVSGMPDGSGVKAPNTRDDIEAAYQFTKKQKRRTPPK